jgi:hypothetical protein
VSGKNKLTPLDFGINDVNTGVDRYWVLYKTHVEALKNGCNIDYGKIDTIKIEIPKDAKPIPLPPQTNFSNTVIIVLNQIGTFTLFSMINELVPFETTIEQFEELRRINNKENAIVVIEDSVPWVNNRIGYSNGHARKDVVYINKGRVNGTLISPYNVNGSKPMFFMGKVNVGRKVFENLTLIRDKASAYKTFVLDVENQYNIIIRNLRIETPENNWYEDNAVKIGNSYKIRLDNIYINRTYSQKDKYGYGITLNNVQDIKINNLKTHSAWGIFGNNNVNNARLKDCDINRFDIHCYGRNVSFEHCIFRDLYNQFSSIYGTISFKKCVFIETTPILIESSYNAYTPFDLYFNDCIFSFNKKRNYIMTLFGVPKQDNERTELKKKCLPNITLKNCYINLSDDLDNWYLIWTGGDNWKGRFDYISSINITGIKVNVEKELKLFSEEINTVNPIDLKVRIKK